MAAELPPGAIQLEPGNARLQFIKVETARVTDAAPVVRLTGKVSFDEEHTQRVASPIDGRVSRILIELGDKVRAGQALKRANKLKQDGAVSEKEAAQAQADFRKSKSDAARTNAQLRSLSVSASDPTTSAAIRSQIAGTIVERNILVGQEVRADSAQPLLTISNLADVWILADVYEQDLGMVRKGDSVTIHVPAYPDEVFQGKVDHIGDVLDPVSRTVKSSLKVQFF
jgi:cobalt-zinc-cadmium efflux system membrane fusion protein